MAKIDLRNRFKKNVGSKFVGANSTWVGRSGNVIAPKAGSQKKTSSGKKVAGGQGGVKSRYSSGVKSREDLKSTPKPYKSPYERKHGRKPPRGKKKRRSHFADTSQWD